MMTLLKPDHRPEERQLLGRLGSLNVRLAVRRDEIHAAQKLRYQIFCEEMSARKSLIARLQKRECDRYDPQCDHLLVHDEKGTGFEKLVGTQRFFLKSGIGSRREFYSQQEFDVDAIVRRHPGKQFMELGRSCILPEYRSKRTMELMWAGTWAYARQNDVDVMLGCASFNTENVDEISESLGFLSRIARADNAWRVPAIASKKISLELLEGQATQPRKALKKLPPLIKGYLRLGAMFAPEAVIDENFGTIDVLVILPVERISQRYIRYYGADATRHRDRQDKSHG